MKSYYAVQAAIRYYSPPKQKQWREPPHLHFVNLQLDTPDAWRAVLAFDHLYGPLLREHVRMKPEMRRISDKAPHLTAEEREQWKTVASKGEFGFSVNEDVRIEKDIQELLRRAWHEEALAIEALQYGVSHHAQQETYGPLEVKVVGGVAGVELYARDLWSFIRVAFLADHSACKTRVCENSDCPAPYYLAARRGQKFCSHKCAVLINVRRFRTGLAAGRAKRKSRGTK